MNASQSYMENGFFTKEQLVEMSNIDNYLAAAQKYMQNNYFSKVAVTEIYKQAFNNNVIPLTIKGFINGFRYGNYLYTGDSQLNASVPLIPIINPINDIFDTTSSDFSLFGNPFSDSTKPWKLSIRVFVFNYSDEYPNIVRAICGNSYVRSNVNYDVPYIYISGTSGKLGIRFSSYRNTDEEENVNIFSFPKTNKEWNKWIRIDLEWKPSTSTFTANLYDVVDTLIETRSADNIEYTLNTTNNTYFGFGTNGHRRDRYGSGLVFDLANIYWTINNEIVWGYDEMNHEGVSV